MSDLVPRRLGGLTVLLSPSLAELGVPHAFTTRDGGSSVGAFASLNLGDHVGDEPEAVAGNRATVAAAFGLPSASLRFCKQVHGTALVACEDWRPGLAADGLLACEPGCLAGVLVADCVPVLLSAPDGRQVAALHAGWRGLAAGMVGAGARALAGRAGLPVNRLVAAVGPCIGPCCYAVGEDVAERFGPPVVRRAAGGLAIDLAAEAVRQLALLGVTKFDRAGVCTACDASFFSHRRDAGVTGRQAGLIGVRPAC